MKSLRLLALAASLLSAGTSFAAEPCSTEGYGPERYEVFVDEPTGFSYIKTPCGWHFVRKIEKEKLAEALQMAKRPAYSEALQLSSCDGKDCRTH